eukprot:1144208-Pelagomonas_calceolata.AAC.5
MEVSQDACSWFHMGMQHRFCAPILWESEVGLQGETTCSLSKALRAFVSTDTDQAERRCAERNSRLIRIQVIYTKILAH